MVSLFHHILGALFNRCIVWLCCSSFGCYLFRRLCCMAVQGDLTFVCLPAVKGRDHLENDVFFASRGDRPSVNVVLFCGDAQVNFVSRTVYCLEISY